MSAIFVTATGTDIGKTFVSAGLLKHWKAAGQPAEAIKPVSTGFDPAEAEGSDAGLLLRAQGKPATVEEIERISPWRFAAPLSPDVASSRERRTLPFDELVDFSKRAMKAAKGHLLIEGVGGVMVPLNDRHTVLDWMVELDAPLIVVTGSYLGTLSHTLTCLDVLKRRDLTIRALVVNETPGSSVPFSDTVSRLKCFASGTPIVALRHKPENGAFKPIADLL